MFSCSYGILNFAAETGKFELEMRIEGDNSPGVDRVIYELTPPDGSSVVSFSSDLNGYSIPPQYIDRVMIGRWNANVKMMTGDVVFQAHSGSLEVTSGMTTKLQLSASYNGSNFDINFDWFLKEDGAADDAGTPAFTVESLHLLPEVSLDYRTDLIYQTAGFRISGNNLENKVRLLELTYPDGAVFSSGSSDARAIPFGYSATDSLIVIKRKLGLELKDINGSYILKMIDPAGNSIRQELAADFGELNPKVPHILGHGNMGVVPDSILSAGINTFQWELSDSSRSGTIITFMVKSTSQEIYPAGNTMATIGAAGELSIPGGTLTPGTWYYVVASIEKVTTTPFDDAVALAINPDMRPESFAESIKAIYGTDTGLVTLSSVLVTVP